MAATAQPESIAHHAPARPMALGEGAAHDRDRPGLRAVAVGELAAVDDADAGRREIAGAGDAKVAWGTSSGGGAGRSANAMSIVDNSPLSGRSEMTPTARTPLMASSRTRSPS